MMSLLSPPPPLAPVNLIAMEGGQCPSSHYMPRSIGLLQGGGSVGCDKDRGKVFFSDLRRYLINLSHGVKMTHPDAVLTLPLNSISCTIRR
jgi:hypothetical protein